jgi:hypothetical protein
VVGTAQDVADAILDWWEESAFAGFNLQLPVRHEDLERFVAGVIPILQASGAYPKQYDGATIRERSGSPYPREAPLAVAPATQVSMRLISFTVRS